MLWNSKKFTLDYVSSLIVVTLLVICLTCLLNGCSSGTGNDSDDEDESDIQTRCAPLSRDEIGSTAQVIGLPPSGKMYHAVFPGGVTDWGEEDDITPNDLSSYEQQAGKSAAWVYFSHNWFRGREFPIEMASWIRDEGSIPFIRLMMQSDAVQDDAEPNFTLDRILKGSFDSDLCEWAKAAREFETPLLVEYGVEVNGEWFSWNGIWNGGSTTDGYGDPSLPDGPERFRDAYRHIITIMREQGAYNITWVFHAAGEDIPDETWNRFEGYYPGDEWIDWIGVSVYGSADPTDDEWPSFRDLMDEIYPRLDALSLNKPIVLLEFGVTAGHPVGDQAVWAEGALKDILALRWPRLIGFSWWNEIWQNDENSAHDTNMRIQDNSDLADVFQTLVGENSDVVGKPEVETRDIP